MIVETLISRYMKFTLPRQFKLKATADPPVLKPRTTGGYVLYIHIPFCESLCPYCTFNRITFESTLAARYFQNLFHEINLYRDLGFQFKAVYVGGGTPTVMPSELAELLNKIRDSWPIEQISVETHPHHLKPDILEALKFAGVNRLSVGVQTFNSDLLKEINRQGDYSSSEEVQVSLNRAQEIIDTVNVDMIFNFPTQTLAMVIEDLRVLRSLQPDQVTFYPLMISERTSAWMQSHYGGLLLRKEKAFYRCITRELFDSYTLSSAWCFTRKSSSIDEYIVANDEYVGSGAGAFGYFNKSFYMNISNVEKYIERIEKGMLPVVAVRKIPVRGRIHLDFLMKLFGTSLNRDYMQKKYGNLVWIYLWKEILFLLITGTILVRGRHLHVAQKNIYRMVILMKDFFSGVNRFRQMP